MRASQLLRNLGRRIGSPCPGQGALTVLSIDPSADVDGQRDELALSELALDELALDELDRRGFGGRWARLRGGRAAFAARCEDGDEQGDTGVREHLYHCCDWNW